MMGAIYAAIFTSTLWNWSPGALEVLNVVNIRLPLAYR